MVSQVDRFDYRCRPAAIDCSCPAAVGPSLVWAGAQPRRDRHRPRPSRDHRRGDRGGRRPRGQPRGLLDDPAARPLHLDPRSPTWRVAPDELAARLAHLHDDGLVVTVLPRGPRSQPYGGAAGYLLSVHGADRPGIVAAVTGTLAEHGGNITDLSTRLGPRGLYLLVAEVELPDAVDVVSLGSAAGRGRPGAGRRGAPAPRRDRRPLGHARHDHHALPHACAAGGPAAVRSCAPPTRSWARRCAEVDPDRSGGRRAWPPTCIATMRVSPGCVGLAANQVGVGCAGVQPRRLRAIPSPAPPTAASCWSTR